MEKTNFGHTPCPEEESSITILNSKLCMVALSGCGHCGGQTAGAVS